MANKKFKNITTKYDNTAIQDYIVRQFYYFTQKFFNMSIKIKWRQYREKLIDLLSHDREGNQRYCNIREYIISPDGPSEKLSEFFCNLMEQDGKLLMIYIINFPKQ